MALAALLLSLSIVVPVFAAENPPTPSEIEPPPTLEGFDPTKLPGSDDITPEIEKAEREDEQRKAWLEGPEATQQREASALAYANLDAGEARDLLNTTFAAQLAQLDSDPARLLSGAQLLSSSEEGSATIKDEGNGLVLESSVPVKTEDEDGDLRKVDVSLEETPDGYETDNSLVEVTIPKAVDEPIEVGERGVSVKLAGADEDRLAQPFGDEDVFAHEVLPDTDMLVSPIATGVEISNILRSEESPRTLRFQVQMPAGAQLQDSEWGAEVVKDGKALTKIPEPVAVDAQGTDIPVDLTVEGNSLLLTVDHHDGNYAMPILVDPILEDDSNWIYGQHHDALDNGTWGFYNAGSWWFRGSSYCIYTCFGPGGGGTRGLFVSLEGQRSYGAGQYGQWGYGAPLNSFISSVTLGPPYVWETHSNCPESQYPLPSNFFGMWSNGWSAWTAFSTYSANQPGGSYSLFTRGDAVVFGLSSGGGISWLPCWRDLYAGGASISLDDDNWPAVQSVQDPPTSWINSTTPVHIVAQASDAGLGVQNVVINSDGSPTIRHIPAQNQCSGTWRSRCLVAHTATFDVHGSSFAPGRRVASVTAYDATGKYSNPYYFETKVDPWAPEVWLDGKLARETNEVGNGEQAAGKGDELSLPVYNLEIKAEDGKAGSAEKDWQSGVKDIEIYMVDEHPNQVVEQEVPWSPSPSCAHNCAMTQIYSLKLSKIETAGKHKLKIVVRDFAGNTRERNIEFEYFPATGMKDEYVMQYFPLPDGSGNEAAEGSTQQPELAVNVMNGNLVYRETDIDVDGTAAADLEIERYYNSQLPIGENTEWGDGWTIAQTPQLQPIKAGGSSVPNEAEIVDATGVTEGNIALPTEAGASKFDPSAQATFTKQPGGGYEMSDETGESAGTIAFDATGQAEALHTDGQAKVDYDYEGGELSEIAVSDPATFSADPSELEIPEPQLITQPTFTSGFGSSGSGDGQLKLPADVAVDPTGNIWVVDRSNYRVEKFDPSGEFLAKFGSPGSGNGQFVRPTAIAIAGNGDLLVTDSGGGRIERFNSTGVFLSKFGAFGTGNGQFAGSGPEGIAVDAAGNIWVADTYGGRLQKFSSAGAYLLSVGTKGTGSGQLGEPRAIEIAPNGEIWVADRSNSRISRFSSAGAFLSSFGSYGTGDGQFKSPSEIEIDALGNAWVADSTNRVQWFDLSGQFKGKFGSAGSGQGQFNLANPTGIAADSKGHLWIADVNNNRIQQWSVPIERPAYMSAFGSAGSGAGQLGAAGDLAVGIDGTIWVVDRSNNRIQRFDSSGKFLAKFGALGPGNGQFNRPTGIAIDREGNLLIADSNNNRIQKFDSDGQFLSSFGSVGTGNGQLSGPEGVVADLEGNIWVADSGNGRVEKFDEGGKFLAVVGSKGTGSGQLSKPTGIDVDPDGNIWVVDSTNNRITIFEPDGDFAAQFGSSGAGIGQFSRPSAVEIDSRGNVWIGDQVNQRVVRFDIEGKYVGQFGTAGSGAGQFSFPTLASGTPIGIATDESGAIWVTDVNNSRVQRWQLGNYQAPEPEPLDLNDGDASVEVETSGGLVDEVSGNAAGTHTYIHSGDDLTAHASPDGETKYQYDGTGRMTKVTLPNGTWGTIAYFGDGRVKSVTTRPAGAPSPKTTEFEYQDEPSRRTTVFPPDAPHMTYDIGDDGSVFKWWDSAAPPTIEPLMGNLFDNKETPSPISAGDYLLTARAYSPEGIASIDIIANGNQLVDEMACKQDLEKPGLECVNPMPVNQWVMETGGFAPGILWIEVLVTDRIGHTASKRFWVNVPEPPPPSIGAPVPPKFKDIKKFREDYGLEVNFPVANEIELNERIFNLIGAWHNPHSQAGEVARASYSRWGVPLRAEDIAELEYREWLYEVNGTKIDEWVEATSPSSYAGYYMDHRAGGVMHIGFVGNQTEQLASLKGSLSLVGQERLQVYPVTPTNSYLQVRATSQSVLDLVASNSTLDNLVVSIEDDEAGKATRVGTPNVAQVESILDQTLGANAPVTVEYEAGGGALLEGRYRNDGRMRAGDYINGTAYTLQGVAAGPMRCTAAFGAKDDHGIKPNGEGLVRLFLLTAGHCYTKLDTEVWRAPQDESQGFDDAGKSEVGRLARNALQWAETSDVRTDGAAIRVKQGGIVPLAIWGWDGHPLPTEPAGRARKGNTVCYSGAISKTVACGEIVARSLDWEDTGEPYDLAGYWVRFLPEDKKPEKGDSGSPVWNRRTGASIGVVSAGRPEDSFTETLVAPLLHPPNMPSNRVPGILHHMGMEPLQLMLGR